MSESERKYSIVPPSEFRCVWMTGGVLSYQLCDRKFDCEHCPLDTALRQRFAGPHSEPERTPHSIGASGPDGAEGWLRFGRKHVWLRPSGDHGIRFGIEPGLASVIVAPKAIVLPAMGERVVRNKVCAWIVLEGGTLPIVSPISGQVRLTNTHLADNPHAVCLSPLDEGWMFELAVEPSAVDDADLLSRAESALVFAEDDHRFQQHLSSELSRGEKSVGPTLMDGGEALEDASEMLGPTKYFKLVREIYG